MRHTRMRAVRYAVIWLVLGSFLTSGRYVLAADVLVSIQPLQLITRQLLENVATPELLITGSGSAHHYVLKPSDKMRIQQAALFVWVGDNMEVSLHKMVAQKTQGTVVTLQQYNDLEWLSFPEHDEHHESDEHAEHQHLGVDPHIWLDPVRVQRIAEHLMSALIQVYPNSETQIRANTHKFTQKIERLDSRIRMRLMEVKEYPYMIDHNFMNYFAARYQLNLIGEIGRQPQQASSVKKLMQLRSLLLKNNVTCIITDELYPNPIVEKLLSVNHGKAAAIDALGHHYADLQDGYFKMLEALSETMLSCLTRDRS